MELTFSVVGVMVQNRQPGTPAPTRDAGFLRMQSCGSGAIRQVAQRQETELVAFHREPLTRERPGGSPIRQRHVDVRDRPAARAEEVLPCGAVLASYRTPATLTNLLQDASHITRYSEVRDYTNQSPTRLEVVAFDDDAHITQAMGEHELVEAVRLLDTGTGILDRATQGILRMTDQIVIFTIISPGSSWTKRGRRPQRRMGRDR